MRRLSKRWRNCNIMHMGKLVSRQILLILRRRGHLISILALERSHWTSRLSRGRPNQNPRSRIEEPADVAPRVLPDANTEIGVALSEAAFPGPEHHRGEYLEITRGRAGLVFVRARRCEPRGHPHLPGRCGQPASCRRRGWTSPTKKSRPSFHRSQSGFGGTPAQYERR